MDRKILVVFIFFLVVALLAVTLLWVITECLIVQAFVVSMILIAPVVIILKSYSFVVFMEKYHGMNTKMYIGIAIVGTIFITILAFLLPYSDTCRTMHSVF